MKKIPIRSRAFLSASQRRESTKTTARVIHPSLEGIVGTISLFGAASTLILMAYIFWEIGFLPDSATTSFLPTVSLLLAALIMYVFAFGTVVFFPGFLMLLMPDTSDQAAAHKFLTYSYVACGLLWIGVAILAVSADKTRYGTVVGLSSIGITPLIIASYFCGQNQKTDYLSLTRSSIFLCMGVAVCASALTWLITIYLALAFGKANDVTNDGQFLVAFVAVYFLTSVPALLLLSWRTAPKSVLAMICVFALLFLQGALNYLGFSPLIAILQHYGIAHMKGSVTLTISEARCIGVNNTYPGFCRLSVGSSPEQDTKLPKQKASKKDTEDLTTNSTSYGIIQGNEMRSRFGDNLLIGVDRRPVDTGPLQKLKTNAGAELSEKQLDGLYTVFVSIPKKDILACTIISGSKIRLDEYKDISIEVLPKKVLKPCI